MSRQLIGKAVRIAAAIALVVVPFGYAITGVHSEVLMGAGCGIAVGMGVGLRGETRGGPWTGILIGSVVGITVALIAGSFSGIRWGFLIPPSLALAVGLIAGLGGSSLSGYRDICRETFIMSVLLTLGFFPAHIAQGIFSVLRAEGVFSLAGLILVAPLMAMPPIALLAGALSHWRKEWRDTRPPGLLMLGAAVPPSLVVYLLVVGVLEDVRGLAGIQLIGAIGSTMILSVLIYPGAAFLLGRAATTWLQPRLRVYGRLADYLRVMWVPTGGFAVGYLTIIVLFAGFYGMLERFQPGAFAGAGTGVIDWLWFAFFNALAQDYAAVAPVSVAARALVGAHLILSVGWALVLFAAVMSSIQPRLERIARRDAEEGRD